MKNLIIKHKISILILAVLIAAGFNGCGTSTTAPVADNLSFSLVSTQDSVGDSQVILVLDTVKVLIKDIKVNVANKNEDLKNFKVGPFVLFLNLFSTINTISTAIIPAGEYDKIKFEIHKLEDVETIPDPEFADANGRYSVIVKGWYLGNYFVFKSSKSAHQRLMQFPNNITTAAETNSNITLIVKPYIWFVKNGVYLDPRDPANENDIDNNIKENINLKSFKVFRDNNRDGFSD
jgi:hypothetical protein